MKNRITAVGLALCLGFSASGCASMLERSYSSSTHHVDRPTIAEDPSVLRVEDYRELVSAVLYLVSEGAQTGVIQLYDYSGPVEEDLPAACLEVTAQDPLGAYCVDYIKHEYTRVLSYYQATLDIHYRRTQEQVRSMVRVTGTGAIRTELRQALTRFAPEVVLRVAYFSEDADFIRELIHQTYYEDPAFALGYPEAEISLYPDSGRERVVEILLTYSEGAEELRRKSARLAAAGAEFVYPWDMDREAAVRQAAAEVCYHSGYDPQGGVTAYAALVEGAANDEGLALAYSLVCRELERVTCEIVEGAWQGEPHFWNEVRFSQGEPLYLDLSRFTELSSTLYTAEEMTQMGYRWPGGPAEESPEESPQASENTL